VSRKGSHLIRLGIESSGIGNNSEPSFVIHRRPAGQESNPQNEIQSCIKLVKKSLSKSDWTTENLNYLLMALNVSASMASFGSYRGHFGKHMPVASVSQAGP
jgi:hypothetical protein